MRKKAAELWLGPELAAKVYASLTGSLPIFTNSMINEATVVTLEVVSLLEELQIPYVIGGSLASTFHGVARATLDADIVAAIRFVHAPILVARLQGDFYVSSDAINEAIIYHRSFNLIHLATFFKVDIFIPKARAFDTAQLVHGIRGSLNAESKRQVRITSPEDTILVKLERYRLGNESSDRQWQDIIGVLRVQNYRLDLDYMRRTARELGAIDLLEIALAEAGISSSPPTATI